MKEKCQNNDQRPPPEDGGPTTGPLCPIEVGKLGRDIIDKATKITGIRKEITDGLKKAM
jgi:hypothetical protein